MDAEELKTRTKKFALRVMALIDLYQEADEITAIMTASHKTAQNHR